MFEPLKTTVDKVLKNFEDSLKKIIKNKEVIDKKTKEKL